MGEGKGVKPTTSAKLSARRMPQSTYRAPGAVSHHPCFPSFLSGAPIRVLFQVSHAPHTSAFTTIIIY